MLHMAREMSERSFDELARGLADGSISRRRALGLIASSAIAALVPSTRALADDDHDGYTVCHVPGRPPKCQGHRPTVTAPALVRYAALTGASATGT
jgi:hypothetical protein